MATAILSFLENMTGDARFRAKGLQISNAIAACGLSKVVDAGQINWATVARPGVNTSAGYEMWQFNDALQATAPIYIKMEYATTAVATIMGLWFTVGSAQDGAGNLVGPTSTLSKCAPSTTITDTQTAFGYVSGSTSRIAMVWGLGAASSVAATCGFFSIERMKDAAGVDTAEGAMIFTTATGTAATLWRQQAFFPTGAGAQESTLGIIAPTVGTGANGTQVAVYPCFLTKGVFLNPSLTVLGYVHPNISAFTPVSITIYGAAHTYLPFGAATMLLGIRVGVTGAAGSALLMRWE